ncbi:MAG: hypothetical protein V4684_02535 [Pseudomonadota bacterium]
MAVHAVNLEDVLGQIEADCPNLHGGRSFRVEWLVTLPLWHIAMPLSGGGVHPIAYLHGTGIANLQMSGRPLNSLLEPAMNISTVFATRVYLTLACTLFP